MKKSIFFLVFLLSFYINGCEEQGSINKPIENTKVSVNSPHLDKHPQLL